MFTPSGIAASFSGTWYFRNRNAVLMNTTNFDGQWTRRVIERLGYQTAQGSSTRGGLRGLAVMAQRLDEGVDAAFTIDGPRGPRYVAKPGPVMLARRSGRPIILFHIGLERAWTLKKTWDLFQIPKPFTRAVLVIAPPLEVAEDTNRERLEQKHQEMQKTLERVRDVAESLVFAHGSGAGARTRDLECLNSLSLARVAERHLRFHLLPAAIEFHFHRVAGPLPVQGQIQIHLAGDRDGHRWRSKHRHRAESGACPGSPRGFRRAAPRVRPGRPA